MKQFWIALLLVAACSSEDSSTTSEQPEPDAAPVVSIDAPPCVHCSAITAGPLDTQNLCQASQPIVTNLMTCLCGAASACSAQCAASVCAGAALSTECRNCAAASCANQSLACLADT